MKTPSLAVVFLLLVVFSAYAFQGYRPAQPGDIVAGVAVTERGEPLSNPPLPKGQGSNPDRLLLNVSPCSEEPQIMEFRKPYRVIRVEDGSCKGSRSGYSNYVRIQVEQE